MLRNHYHSRRDTIHAMRLLGVLCLVSAGLAAGVSPDNRVRDAAARGVALIQASQTHWPKQGCYSCHHQSLPPFAFRAARDHGIPVNQSLERASAEPVLAIFRDLDRAVQYTHLIDPAMSEAYLMLAAAAEGLRPNIVTAVYARHLAARQKADGHWETLDVRPPQSYSSVTATAVALRAIQIYSHTSLAEDTRSRIERARTWLGSVSPRSTEERATQLMGLKWSGADRQSVNPLVRTLKLSQQPDGGWPSREGLGSDAYSTGEVLVALHEAGGVPTSDAAWRRGVQYLVDTQASDGSWHVISRIHPPAPVSPPYFETGFPYQHDQFISIMGASWAVRALAAALPEARTIEPAAVAPGVIEPWVETALFGSTADLRGLLDKGLDPNAATKSGGTTLLMLAQPDLEKTKFLAGRGANINARARTKYSALLVAAQYPTSGPTIEFLLERGAEVVLPKGSGSPLFNATPFILASIAGNAAILPRLRQAGDKTDSKMMMLGTFPATALLTAVFFRDVKLARTILDCGVRVDQPDDDGITPLGWAAIGNEPGVARLLIERGADVNHIDRFGMTPLLYAASVDFGDSTLIDLLIKSGAMRGARSKDGLDASGIARKYGHSQYLKSLSAGL